MVKKNRTIIESYQLVSAKNNIGIYGQRLILRLVQIANEKGYVEGVNLKECPKLRDVQFNSSGEATFFLPLTDLMGTSEEYNAVKAAVRQLTSRVIEYKDGDRWVIFSLLTRVEFDRKFGAKITVQPEFYEALLDFSKGFRRFELGIALKMKSVYSLRLYLLMAGQKEPLFYSIDELKDMLTYRGKGKSAPYPNPHDFIRRVIEPAKEELDNCSPYTFEYETIRKSNKTAGRRAITAIKFYPVQQVKFEDLKLRKEMHSLTLSRLTEQQKRILMEELQFERKMLQNNIPLFETAAKHIDLTDWLRKIVTRVEDRRPANLQGYVVKALQLEMEELGIEY